MATDIEWVKNLDGTKGETWNPVTGCSKISAGCKNCYAERMAKRLAGRFGYPEQPHHFDIAYHPDKLEQPYRWKKPRMVFVCSMGDLFHEEVSPEYISKIFKVIEDNSRHTFQILTKRIKRMEAFVWKEEEKHADYFYNLYPNVWLGVTAENQEAWDKRVYTLLSILATVRFVSVEPMLSEIDFGCIDVTWEPDWVICGGETGAGAREMKIEWAESLYKQCQEANIPFFFKKAGDSFRWYLSTNALRLNDIRKVREYPKR